MSKYDRLGTYLRGQGRDQVPLTFAEIERIVGAKLPKSQEYPAWWSNSTSNNVMTKVWLDAGYRTEQVDTAAKKLVFRRIAGNNSKGRADVGARARRNPENKVGLHPLIGSMKGTFAIESGYDLTSPMCTDEEWAEIEKLMDEDWDQIEQGMSKKGK